jgi:hypothetical protein
MLRSSFHRLRHLFAAGLLLAGTITSMLAQETVGGVPYSLRSGLDMSGIPVVLAAPFDALAVAQDDADREELGQLPLYGRFQALDVDPYSAGEWTILPNGDGLWRLRIASPGAQGIELFADAFDLPERALLHVYSADGEQLLGGYTAHNRQPDGSFSSHMVYGDACVVEYYEPLEVRGRGWFHFDRLSHGYRMITDERAAGACQVDVNCSEGANWTNQRDAVVRIRVVIPQGTGWCTGTLVNNTARDCKPYILSALHCSIGSTAANFNQYQFRFRYQRSGCGTGTIPGATGNTITGCVKRADSNDNGGNNGSDFILLELNSPVPASYNAFFAGWNVGTNASPNGVSIHHPSGDEKKISTYTQALTNSGWGINNTHWRVVWASTANGYGVTEGGSSGSPIFDPNKRIVGTLTGGGSCCDVNACGSGTAPYVPDYYGKMSHHWTLNPNAADQKLKLWLDPLNTNVTVFDGEFEPCLATSVEEVVAHAAPSVHPNPGMDRVTVRFPESIGAVERMDVVDLSGRVVFRDRPAMIVSSTIDVSAWAPGTYLITLTSAKGRSGTARFVVMGR